jgi:hypothetical protein
LGWQHRAQVDATASDWVLRFDGALGEWTADEPPPLPPPAILPLSPAMPVPAAPVRPSPTEKVVRLGAAPELDVPASRVTKWWVDHPELGRVSVHVPVGSTPREALTIAFAERGYQTIR